GAGREKPDNRALKNHTSVNLRAPTPTDGWQSRLPSLRPSRGASALAWSPLSCVATRPSRRPSEVRETASARWARGGAGYQSSALPQALDTSALSHRVMVNTLPRPRDAQCIDRGQSTDPDSGCGIRDLGSAEGWNQILTPSSRFLRGKRRRARSCRFP